MPDNSASHTTANSVFTVSQLNRLARSTLEELFTGIVVEGEISELLQHRSGHWYFTLKDEQSQLRVAMFRGANQRVRFSPANGDLVQLKGQLSVYEARGSYQFIASTMDAAGEGKLQREFERLKKQLAGEGLFDQAHKQTLPPSPQQVALVTSPQGAAIEDMLSTFRRRNPGIELIVVPVAVQGANAAGEIATAINAINRNAKNVTGFSPDVIIVGRGGGSLEDLWAFNEEAVARAIYQSHIPVVSAVGHEVDFSIADLVADVRAATPTAAAELVAPDQQHQRHHLDNAYRRLVHATDRYLSEQSQTLKNTSGRLQHPAQKIQQQAMRLDHLDSRLTETMRSKLQTLQHASGNLQQKLAQHSPAIRIEQLSLSVNYATTRFNQVVRALLNDKERALSNATASLDIVSPLGTLRRGFSITTKNGNIVRSIEQLNVDEPIQTILKDGEITATITAKQAGKTKLTAE